MGSRRSVRLLRENGTATHARWVALAILIGTTSAALAGGGFDIVIPGRPGVPIIINGVDASYAVVEGDWGLGKDVQVQPTIYGGRYVDPEPQCRSLLSERRSSCRATAVSKSSRPPTASCRSRPRAIISPGRRNPLRRRPQPDVPFYPPPVIVAPQSDDRQPADLAGRTARSAAQASEIPN